MIYSIYQDYRKELIKYKRMTVSAVINKYFPSDGEIAYYALDIEVEILPKTDEEVEKNIIASLYKSTDLEKILNQYNNLQMNI